MLQVEFVSLFPEMVLGAVKHSILNRASDSGLVCFGCTNPRDFARDNHRTVDDSPFGGGPGMVMKCEPLADAIESLPPCAKQAIVLTDPTGTPFKQEHAHVLAGYERIVFLCGHYEGIDDRIRQRYATHVFSIGDYVLTGGELASLVMADAVVRTLPGALGSSESLLVDSHSEGLLSAPQFTRPEEYFGIAVPAVLRSGDHGAIASWRRRQSLELTRRLRPDLFWSAPLERSDLKLLSPKD